MNAVWSLARTMTFAAVGDTEAAQAEFRLVCADDFAMLSPAGARTHLLELAWVTEAATLLGDRSCAEQLHRMLQPWDGLHCYPSPAVYIGPMSLFLGMLERLMQQDDAAERHLDDAVVLCDGNGAVSAGALARSELLVLLETRSAPRDAARGREPARRSRSVRREPRPVRSHQPARDHPRDQLIAAPRDGRVSRWSPRGRLRARRAVLDRGRPRLVRTAPGRHRSGRRASARSYP